jgi:hypothetical protein
MIYLYKYLFFRIYSMIKKLNRNISTLNVAHNAIILLSFLITVDLDCLISYIATKMDWDYTKLLSLCLLFFIYFTNLILFFKVFDYENVVSDFSVETKQAKVLSIFLTIIIILVSLIPILKIVI